MTTIRIAVVAALVVGGCASAAANVQNALPSSSPEYALPRSTRENALPRSTPEAEGVATQGIEAFLDAVAESGLEVHGFMLMRNGKVVAEGWWNPYGRQLRHVMFSVSKSVTSLGVGIAADEGKLSLDDRVVSFFPEYMNGQHQRGDAAAHGSPPADHVRGPDPGSRVRGDAQRG